jgi:hypothetical protein
VTLTHYNLDGTLNPGNGVTNLGTIPLTPTLVDHVLGIDFGSGGIGGSESLPMSVNNYAALTSADGYYKLSITANGQTFNENFYRLFGDVVGTGGATQTSSTVGVVTSSDVSIVSAASNQVGPNLNADINGAGSVNANDRLLVAKSLGRRLVAGLHLDD